MGFADFANLGGCYLIKSHLSQTIFFFVSVLCESAANLDTIYRLLGVHLGLDMMGQLMGEQPAIKYTKIT